MVKRLLFFVVFLISVSAFSQCTLQLDSVPVSCYGGTDGEIIIYASNGTLFSNFRFELSCPNILMATQTNCCGPVATPFPYDSAIFPFLPADTFIIVVTEIDDNSQNIPGGCVRQDTIIVAEPPALNAGANNNINICENSSTFDLFPQLNGTPDVGGSWTESGNTVSNMFNPSTYGTGTYTLTYTVSSSTTCSAAADVTVIVNPLVDAGLNGSNTVCENDPVFNLFNYLAGSPDVGGIWTDVNNIPVPNMFNPSISGSGTFIYTYTVLGTLPCLDAQSTVTVVVNPQPVVTISGTTTIPLGMSIGIDFTLTSGTAPFIVVYDDGTGPITSPSFNSTTGTIIVTPNDTTTYTLVSVTDANNCTATANGSVTITVVVVSVNYTVDSVTTINESCCGNDGRIQIHISPPTDSSLSYSIDNMLTWQDSATFDSLEAGNYHVVVQDTNGYITDWGNVVISADTIPDIDMSVHITDIICNGDTNGTFRVLYPDSCYSYTLWRYTISPPYYLPIDTGTYFNGLIPGSYGVVAITNSGNCIDSALSPIGSALSPPLVINEPTSLIQNGISVKEVRCSNNGICDGEITLSSAPTGGIPPYYYSILDYGNNIPFGPIGSDSTFSGLCTDSFEVTLFDANACKVIDTVFVADSTLYIDSVITTNVSCFGFGNGTAIVYAHGGYKPYSYIWSNGDSTMIVDSLTNMQYSVILSDTQNCLAFDTINISQPGEFFFNIKVVDGYKPESCKEVSYDGEFYMNYQGGTAPFNWSWIGTSGATGFGIGDTIFNLTFDTLTLFVTDANGCVGQPAWIHADSARVDALNALNPLVLDSVYADSILCYGLTTASIFIDVKSGEPTYTYSIDSGLTFTTDSFFTNLPAGNYNIEVRDTFGCSVYDTVIISQATEIIIFWDSTNHVKCFAGTDGYLSVSAAGGYAPYQYSWNPSGSSGNIASSLSAGMHIVSVTDAQGCIKADSLSIIELTPPLTSNAIVTSHASCYDSADGSATISVQGGMPPYTVNWGGGVDTNALDSGTYVIVINDSFNCGPIYDTVNISHPTEFLIDILSNIPNLCFGDSLGEIAISASGGTMPYDQYFARDVVLGNTMMYTISTISDLAASNYDIWAMDANGCPSDTLKAVKIGEPGEIQISASSDSLTCFGSDDGVLELTLIGGTSPYEYVFSKGSSILTSGNINQTTLLVFNALAANTYTLNVLDDNYCPKTSVFILSEPIQVIAAFISSNTSGKETFTVNLTNNSLGANVFYWDYDDGNQEILGISEIPTHSYNLQGQYEIMLVAENSLLSQNCNDTTFVTIDVQGFDVFNVFSPNDDGVNDIFDFDVWSLSSMYVEIYNRWGEKIYHWDSPNGSWNGKTYNDDDAPDGVYYFYLKANGEDGYLYQQQGSITLLR